MLTRRSLFCRAAVAVVAVPMVALLDEFDLDLSDRHSLPPPNGTGNAGDIAITAGAGSPSLQEALDLQDAQFSQWRAEQQQIWESGWAAFREGMDLKRQGL